MTMTNQMTLRSTVLCSCSIFLELKTKDIKIKSLIGAVSLVSSLGLARPASRVSVSVSVSALEASLSLGIVSMKLSSISLSIGLEKPNS